ncbi:hypothetical protein GCM10007385_46820 [Tateyamaria omphalii]|uniref:hypothetical protein n=1 Tax=Tateyamaria omphalii TaxID=299262 RepID=UPI001678B527|nr:hypothetical protein [Tateyamaria omphalii]GGX72639.1 hypothetical protein GCM10007385_46820 [Tateyamaria omphalii]
MLSTALKTLGVLVLFVVLLTGNVFAQGNDVDPDVRKRATDFTQEGAECQAERVKPDWFNEGADTFRTKWKVTLREDYYRVIRREHALETGECDCAARYPDPTPWKAEFDELIALHTNPQGLKVFPEFDPNNRLTHRLSKISTNLNFQLVEQCFK